MVSVPKKFFKRAVKRNLLKRRIREAYRTQKELLPAERGVDVLFVYSSASVTASEQINKCVADVLNRIASSTKVSDGDS